MTITIPDWFLLLIGVIGCVALFIIAGTILWFAWMMWKSNR